ncbi:MULTISPECIES: hypothetical protein [Thermoanaerobacterium]|uniref:Uncharacterized protein n=2 Tax=Thermoanaerobacterium TaxID=28895 RepID=W9EA46_9THEO|nr:MULTISPECIES: hypothetical protein [Thermoanaerobacterium]AFK87429.1 hypothetical protein Tsac_2431 [Thermoanaerobacterium saccharolyticum JW/SL-YS485]ETO37800.1 hypothetical protein V518_2054 [Thermoanaerobacterium aotearoense SCUT27]
MEDAKENQFKQNIIFKMEGSAFQSGYDLYNALLGLKSFQDILDKAYLTIVNKERITKTDRQIYKVKANSIYEGSFIADLSILACGAVQIAMPIVETYSPSLLWEITKNGFEYLKIILEARKDNKAISLKQENGSGNMILSIGNNNAPIYIIDPSTYKFSNRAFPDIASLASCVDGENISNITIEGKEDKKIINIGQEERKIFNLEPILDEEPFNFIGEIFRIDTHLQSGKLTIISCDDNNLNGYEFNFELLDDSGNLLRKCCALINREAEFIALRKIQYNPITLKDEIKSLKIYSANEINK